MKSCTTQDRALTEARCRIYKFLSAQLAYPSLDSLGELSSEVIWAKLHRGMDAVAPEQKAALNEALKQVYICWHAKSLVELEEDYLRTFGSSPRGRIAPYECEYGNKEVFQFASELADISAFYSVFGLNACGQERADHIAAECEFMAFLCAKELIAGADGNSERFELIVEAEHKFLEEHLARWATAFAHQLGTASRGCLYSPLAKILSGVLAADCARMNIMRGAAFLPLREVPVADDPENCISCGKEEGLPGAEA